MCRVLSDQQGPGGGGGGPGAGAGEGGAGAVLRVDLGRVAWHTQQKY